MNVTEEKNLEFKIYHKFILPVRKEPMDYISGVFALIGGYFTLSEIELAVLKTQVLLEVFREHKLTCCAS